MLPVFENCLYIRQLLLAMPNLSLATIPNRNSGSQFVISWLRSNGVLLLALISIFKPPQSKACMFFISLPRLPLFCSHFLLKIRFINPNVQVCSFLQ